ncbi:MAG: CCA tRNA nucleotidyltransferase [Clostridia bacterium]
MLKDQALLVLAKLEEHGYEAYFVGGCVRDWLLKRPVHDIDICTNAQPCDIMRIFPDHILTGIQHGTISVKQGGALFEVTTYRTEGTYADHRHPSEVRFVSDLREDLARRDFTINAMAIDRHDRLSDPFSGQTDLLSKLIRTVGSATERFTEDALRLLRAARFAAQLQFAIENKTEQAMAECAEMLIHIAKERIHAELHKLIDSDHPGNGVNILVATRLLRVFPELERLFDRAASWADRLTKLGSIAQKWAFLFYAAETSLEESQRVADLLRMSNRERDKTVELVGMLQQIAPKWDQPIEVEWGPMLLRYGWETCMEADNLLQSIWTHQQDRASSRSLIYTYEQMPVKSLKDLAITGRDLLVATGKKPGPWVAHTLTYLLEQTAFHSLPNTLDALLAAARKEVERYEHQTGDTESFSGES